MTSWHHGLQTNIITYSQAGRQANRQAIKHTYRQAIMQTIIYTHIHRQGRTTINNILPIQAGRHTDGDKYIHAGMQTTIHTHKHINTHIQASIPNICIHTNIHTCKCITNIQTSIGAARQ